MAPGKKNAILVTGGAGFIGSHTVVEMLEENLVVVVIDNLSNASPRVSPDRLPPSLERVKKIVGPELAQNMFFYQENFGDAEILQKIFDEFHIEAVIHFGGFKAVGESKEKPLMYYKNNVGETIKLLQVMDKNNVKSMIFSSSATVYSAPGPKDLPMKETSPVGNCTCPYASTKFFIENILSDLCYADDDWKIVSLRYFNPVGAHKSGEIGEDPKGIPNNLMPYIAQVAVGRRPHLNVFGNDYETRDGTGVRDYVHVVDLAKGHLAALRVIKQKRGFVVYNLGTGVGTSVLEMLNNFSEVAGKKLDYKICARRPGDLAEVYCDPSVAERELGWKATKTVKDMCQDLWKFQSSNPNGY